jgi:hypothetical protein
MACHTMAVLVGSGYVISQQMDQKSAKSTIKIEQKLAAARKIQQYGKKSGCCNFETERSLMNERKQIIELEEGVQNEIKSDAKIDSLETKEQDLAKKKNL